MTIVVVNIHKKESLSEIVLCLNAVAHHLYHAGIQSTLTKSNLAHANNQRHWKILYDYAQVLIHQATPLYHNDPSELDVDGCVYALDSTTIDLCLSLFPWAHFRKTKSAVKMHTMINLQGKIPDFILISTGKMHDVHAMDQITWEAGCWYVMDPVEHCWGVLETHWSGALLVDWESVCEWTRSMRWAGTAPNVYR